MLIGPHLVELQWYLRVVRLGVAIATCFLLVTAVTESGVQAQAKGSKRPTSKGESTRPPSKGENTPWSRGVSEASQQRALELFRDGNVYLEQSKYTEAVALYEQALSSWDH